jgi:hypothetical protein
MPTKIHIVSLIMCIWSVHVPYISHKLKIITPQPANFHKHFIFAWLLIRRCLSSFPQNIQQKNGDKKLSTQVNETGLPDFYRGKMYQTTTKLPQIFRMALNYSRWPLKYSRWPKNIVTVSIPRPSTITQIGIFGLKICTPSGNPATKYERSLSFTTTRKTISHYFSFRFNKYLQPGKPFLAIFHSNSINIYIHTCSSGSFENFIAVLLCIMCVVYRYWEIKSNQNH